MAGTNSSLNGIPDVIHESPRKQAIDGQKQSVVAGRSASHLLFDPSPEKQFDPGPFGPQKSTRFLVASKLQLGFGKLNGISCHRELETEQRGHPDEFLRRC